MIRVTPELIYGLMFTSFVCGCAAMVLLYWVASKVNWKRYRETESVLTPTTKGE